MATTTSKFRIIPPLYDLDGAEFELETDLGLCRLRFLITSSGMSAFRTKGAWQVIGDDLGSMHNTLVEVEMPGVLSTDPPKDQPGVLPEAQRFAVDQLNRIIDHYRLEAQAPQVRRVPYKHARGFRYEVRDDNGNVVQQGAFAVANALRLDGEPGSAPAGNPTVIQAVREGARSGAIKLWQSICMDALADFDANADRSGLAHLYMAFEMLAANTCHRLGEAAVGSQAVEAFLKPAGEDGPSIYAVIKKCNYWAANSQTPNTKLTNRLRKFWQHRNDVMHGRELTVSETEVRETRDNFHRLASWLGSLRPSTDAARGSS